MGISLVDTTVQAFSAKAGSANQSDYSVIPSENFFLIASEKGQYQVTFKSREQDVAIFSSNNSKHDVSREEAKELLQAIQLKLRLEDHAKYASVLKRLGENLPSNVSSQGTAPEMALTQK